MKRQEEKYFISHQELSLLLVEFNAKPTYPVRRINSIYFDTPSYSSFSDSEEGVVPRSKFRYRWYGDLNRMSKEGALEIKITKDHHREKTSDPVSFDADSDLLKCFQGKVADNLIPVCQVSYQRLYFENLSGVRFTYDFDIVTRLPIGIGCQKIPKTVLEVKYQSNVARSDFSSLLGDRKTRFSKYNEAVLALRLI